MSSKVVCSASTSYKKQAGTLTLYKNRKTIWSPGTSTSANDQLVIDGYFLVTLFASKEGSAKVVLRVNVLFPGAAAEQALNFTLAFSTFMKQNCVLT